MSRDPDLLPSLRTLGDRLGDAAEREIDEERRARPRRRRRLLRRGLVAGGIAGVAFAGAVTATDVFTGSGPSVPQEPEGAVEPGVLTDSAAADPTGGLPWALRVFVDDRGRECMQLGRLRGGALGTVVSGQFQRYEGSPNGVCSEPGGDPVSVVVEQRPRPAERTIVYGLIDTRDPVRIELQGRARSVRPGALGGFVMVYEGLLDARGGTLRTRIDGRAVRRPLRGP